jgi:hypothetical protein
MRLAYLFLVTAMLIILGFLVGCGNSDNDDSTVDTVATITDIPAPSIDETALAFQLSPSPTPTGPSLTPSPTFPATHTPQSTALPASLVPTQPPTQVPPPYIDDVRQGDTCGSIAVRWGLDLVGGAAAIRAANNLNANCTNLPYPGKVVIPRPTGTPTPLGFEVTQTVIATSLPPSLRDVTPYALYQHCIQEGDTLTSLSLEYNTSRQRICELNPLPDGIDCRGCNFAVDGPNARCAQAPLFTLTKCLNVPGPTHTPQPTATFTGLETATPFPTYLPPSGIYPLDGASVRGTVQMVWLSVGQLREDEYYMVSIYNEQTGELLAIHQTQQTSYTLPSAWQPLVGQSLTVVWSVEVISRPTAENYLSRSGRSATYRFIWQG